MERFTKAVRLALANQNWYGALSTALILPDICGWLETPEIGSRKRYVDWYERYLEKKYTGPNASQDQPNVFLSGDDCYALRCSYLHEGGDNIIEQKARKVIERFHFVAPRQGHCIHCNQSNNILQLQVDVFCEDVCCGVEEWVEKVAKSQVDVQKRLKRLLTVYSIEGDVVF